MVSATHVKEQRKVEVQKLRDEGLTQREISEKLSVSLKTINNYCHEIKYEVKRKTKLSSFDEDLIRVANLDRAEFLRIVWRDLVLEDNTKLAKRIKNTILFEFERRLEIIPTSEIIKLTKEIIELDS